MGKRSREKRERRWQAEQQSGGVSRRRSGLEKIYFSIIEWGIYLALFTPLIFFRDFFFPYVVPKTIFFRIIVDIILIAYILLVISNPRYRPRINALTIALTVFLGITILTSFTGINLAKSFWSTFERMTGLITFFHLFAFFIVLTSVFKERKYWERILTVSIIVGVLLSFYVFTSSDPTARGGGTIGNTSFLAAYLLFDIFFAISLFLVKTGKWRIFYGLTLIPMIWLLLFPPREPCRGAIGAFYGGIFILALGYLFFRLFFSKKQILKKLAPLLIVLLILASLGFSQLGFFKEKWQDLEQSSGWQARMVVWQLSFEGWQEKFWLGWGPENFNIAFAKHFDPRLALPEYGLDVWYDRVHNIVFDTASASGLLGLLSYLVILGVAIFGLLKTCSQVVEKRNIFLPLGVMALLVVYFIQNFLVFDMISSYLMFFLTLAFVYFLTQGREPEMIPQEKEERSKGISSLVGALLIVITLFTIYFGNIQPARASNYIVKGIALPLEEAVPSFQKAIKTSPMSIFEAPEQFSRKVTELVFEPGVDREVLGKSLELAAEKLKKALAQGPRDFRLYLLLGRQYNDFYQLTRDPAELWQAETSLEKAIEISPKNQQGYWSLAQTRLSQGRAKESVDLMQKALDLEPRFDQSHWYLAMTYKLIGEYELALEKVKDAEAVGLNWKTNLENLKNVIEIYQELQGDEELVELYLLAIEKRPQNAQFWAGLAVAYANLGQFDKARESAKEALALNPDFAPEIEEFLKSLPQ